MEKLGATKRALNECIVDNQKQMRTAQRKKARQNSREADSRAGALVMCCRWNGNGDAVRAWLLAVRMAPDSVNRIATETLSRFAIMTDAEKHGTATDAAAPAICSTKYALKCCQEFELYNWVAHQNLSKGLAPTSKILLEHQSTSPLRAARGRPLPKPKSNFQWARRWRRRWDISLGRFANRETLPALESQTKEMCNDRVDLEPSITCILVTHWFAADAEKGATTWRRFRARIANNHYTHVHFVTLIWGPETHDCCIPGEIFLALVELLTHCDPGG